MRVPRLFSFRVVVLAAIAFSGNLVAAGTESVTSAATTGGPREIRVHLPMEPVSLDPALTEDDVSIRVQANITEGLVGYDGGGKLKNMLAETIKVSNGGKTYTFKLRSKVSWSDGVAVTAEQFVVGIRHALDPATGAKVAALLFPIRGAQAYSTGQGTAELLGVTAKGKDQVVIELSSPAPYFVHVLALPEAAPLRADILLANHGKWPALAPSTGAYHIVSYKVGVEIRLEPSPGYWNAHAGTLPVLFRIIPEEATAATLFESGALDVVAKVTPLDIDRFRAQGVVHEFQQVSTYFLAFNAKRPPFNDREFRRAVAGSIDRQQIVDLLRTANHAALSWIPPLIEGYLPYRNTQSHFAASVAQVKKQLALAPVEITAALNNSDINSLVMEKVQNDLKTNLGLTVHLASMEWKAYIAAVRNNTPQLYRFARGVSFLDPIWHLSSFQSGNPNNPTGWKNEHYDRLVDEVASLPAGPKRRARIEQAQKILTEDDAIVIPLFHGSVTHLVSKRLRGFRMSPTYAVYFDEVSLVP